MWVVGATQREMSRGTRECRQRRTNKNHYGDINLSVARLPTRWMDTLCRLKIYRHFMHPDTSFLAQPIVS